LSIFFINSVDQNGRLQDRS